MLDVRKKKSVPFEFVLEELANHSYLQISTKPMFGCIAVYSGEKIVLILRDRPKTPEDNGVWLATSAEHHESLREIFPSMRSLKSFGDRETGYQILPADSPDFESAVMRACELVAKDDPRIGKVPKPKAVRRRSTAKRGVKKKTPLRRGRKTRIKAVSRRSRN